MKTTILALAFALTATAASAQTLVRKVNLLELGWGNVEIHKVDIDGNPATIDWAVHDQNSFTDTYAHWRVVRELSTGGFCVGDWFDPRLSPYGFDSVELLFDGSKHVLRITGIFFGLDGSGTYPYVAFKRLDVPPACK